MIHRGTGLLLLLLALGCGDEPATAVVAEPAEEPIVVTDEPPPVDAIPEIPTVGDLLPEEFSAVWQPWLGDFDAMVERRIVRVVIPYGGYQFYYDNGRPRGAVYELLQRFESYINDHLSRRNVRVYVVIIPVSRDQLIPAVISGHADLAAGDLTVTDARRQVVDFSRPLLTNINEIIVTGPAAEPLERLEDIAGREIFLRESSSYFEHMQDLKTAFVDKGLPEPVLRIADEMLEAEDIMEMLDTGIVGTTILDDYKARFWAGVFPNVVPRDDLVISQGGSIAWAMRKQSPGISAMVSQFLRENGRGTLIGNDTYNRYLGKAERVRCSNSASSYASVATLAGHFKRFAAEYDFDWLMLAAQGLQESGLRQNRRSPAGAVGIMQIKPSTAADRNVGIDDISTAENNIHAGTKYLRFIADRYFSSAGFDGLNTWFFSLAAYNAGPAKINRYRREARELGYNPDIWFDNVEIIAAKRIGRETVTYVSNIFKYYINYQLVAARGAIFDERFGEVLTACNGAG